MARLENDDSLPNFSEMKRVIDSYEDKMKHDSSELDKKRQALEDEEAKSRQEFEREKEDERQKIEEERQKAILQVEKNAADVRKEKDDWEAEKKSIQETKSFGKVVTLNVGGTRYTTSQSTLRKYPDSMLGVMFSGRHALDPQADGSFFIDRDGEVFRHVLSYLRDSTVQLAVAPTLSEETRLRLQNEAKFYQLPELEAVLQTVNCSYYSEIEPKKKDSKEKVNMDYGEQVGIYTHFLAKCDNKTQARLYFIQKASATKKCANTECANTECANTEFTGEVNFTRCDLSGLSFRNCWFQQPVSFEGCVLHGTVFHNVGGLVTHKTHFTPGQVAQAAFQPELLKALQDNGCIY